MNFRRRRSRTATKRARTLRLRFSVQGRLLDLAVPEQSVFVPNLVGLLNAATVSVRRGETVVDAGTGSGLHAILCAKLGAGRVIACDVNPAAIAAARRNARLNGVASQIEFVRGSFEKALTRAGKDVGLVVSTLPSTRSGHRALREAAMRAAPRVSRHLDGGSGEATLNARLVRAAAPMLAPGGRLHLHLVDWSDEDAVLAALKETKLSAAIVARAHVPVWGQRCNAAAVYKSRAADGPWRVRFGDLPKKAGTGVRVVEAGAGRRPKRVRKAREFSVRVL